MKLGFEQLFWVVGGILILPFIIQQGSELSTVDAPRYPAHELRSLPTVQPAVAATAGKSPRLIDLSPARESSSTSYQTQLDAELAELIDSSVASLIIPRLQLEVPVFTAANQLTLTLGASVVPARADLHAAERIGMASYQGGAFRNLKELEVGDILLLRTQQRLRQFRVSDSRVVDSAALTPGQSALPNQASRGITLTSFAPEQDASAHHVVTASEVGHAFSGHEASDQKFSDYELSAHGLSPHGASSGTAANNTTFRF